MNPMKPLESRFLWVALLSLLSLEACTTVVVRRPPGYYAHQRCRMNHPYRPWLCR